MRVEPSSEPIVDTVRMRQELAGLADRRGKIARMLEAGELVGLRRGLYARRRDLDPRFLAGPIYGPSYVSFETALAWHGMIPEGVAETVSATLKRAAEFENAFGRFRYLTIPHKAYPIGIRRAGDDAMPWLVASPTKAIVDRIAREPGFRSTIDVGRWLDGMRLDLQAGLDAAELAACAQHYGRPSVRCLLRFAEKNHLLRP